MKDVNITLTLDELNALIYACRCSVALDKITRMDFRRDSTDWDMVNKRMARTKAIGNRLLAIVNDTEEVKMTKERLIHELDGAELFLRNRAKAKQAPLNQYDIEMLLYISNLLSSTADKIINGEIIIKEEN